MGDATLLNLDQIAAGQQQMYQTSNDADAELEKATNELLDVAMSGSVALTGPQFTRAFTFVLSGSVTHNLTVPATKRIFAVENNSSASQNVVRGSTSIAVSAGDVAIFKTDGTTNGLKALVGSSGASGSAGGDLTGTYPNPAVAGHAITNAKLAQMATHTVKGNKTGGIADAADLTVSELSTMLALVASATTDTTDAGNISTGTLSNSRLSGVELSANKGANNGYAPLDPSAKVPLVNLPASIQGGLNYQGTWNANTNSPALASGVGTKGFFYKVSVAGATTIDGISQWNVGDSIVFDGTVWDKLDGIANEVVSVAGKTGVVALDIGDLTAIADARLVGNNTGGSHAPVVLTAANVKTLLAIAAGDVSGLAASATTDTTSATNISSGTLAAARLAAIRYDLAAFYPGVPGNSQLILRYQAARAITIPAGATNSQASSGTAATASTTLTIKLNGASVGTIVWSIAGTAGAFTVASPIVMAAGDVLTITGPASADATIADIAITLAATA